MLKRLIGNSLCKISVYDGISPSLLATMSLSVSIGGKTHEELIDNLVKSHLIQQDAQIHAFRQLNRQLFTHVANPFENKPYPISKGESMTDIFTHSVIINNLGRYWKDNMKILQIGTGHGYLSFLIATILQKKCYNQYNIKGIDINDQAIQYCKDLIKKIQLANANRLYFQATDLGKFLQSDQQNRYDAIIGGYYFDQNINDRLIGKLKEGGVGIWPTRSESGQALYKMQKGKQRVYLIQTMFSMPIIRSQVSKYFFQPGQEQCEQSETNKLSQVIKQVDPEVIKAERSKKVQRLRGELKLLLQKHRKADGKLPKLQEMKEIPQIKSKLDELNKFNIKKEAKINSSVPE